MVKNREITPNRSSHYFRLLTWVAARLLQNLRLGRAGCVILNLTAAPEHRACASLSNLRHLDSGVPAQRLSDLSLAHSRMRSMQYAGFGLRRTPLPGTWMHKGKRKGRGPAVGLRPEWCCHYLLLTDSLTGRGQKAASPRCRGLLSAARWPRARRGTDATTTARTDHALLTRVALAASGTRL